VQTKQVLQLHTAIQLHQDCIALSALWQVLTSCSCMSKFSCCTVPTTCEMDCLVVLVTNLSCRKKGATGRTPTTR
jgi:hypothetical protein